MTTTTQTQYTYKTPNGRIPVRQTFDTPEEVEEALTFKDGVRLEGWEIVQRQATFTDWEQYVPQPVRPTEVRVGQVWSFSRGTALWRITHDATLSVDTMTFWGAEQVAPDGTRLGPVTDWLETTLLARGILVEDVA